MSHYKNIVSPSGETEWEVERRYHEFYILESKLTEFHGEFCDNSLPSRRSLFASKDMGFMNTKRQVQRAESKYCLFISSTNVR